MTDAAPLYTRILGDSWTGIAEPVRRMHAANSIIRAHGSFRVEHGRRRLARLVARILQLPQPSAAAQTRLIVTPHGNGERWQRTFDGRRLETRQYESKESELVEIFGVLEFRFHLNAPSDGSLVYIQREAAFLVGSFRLPIPVSWAPQVEAREEPAGPNGVQIRVRVVLPSVGTLITYDGIIEIEDMPA